MKALVENLHLELGGLQIRADIIGSEKTISEVTDLLSACTEQLEIADDVRLERFDDLLADRLGSLLLILPEDLADPRMRYVDVIGLGKPRSQRPSRSALRALGKQRRELVIGQNDLGLNWARHVRLETAGNA